jgi:selenide,water dikinase
VLVGRKTADDAAVYRVSDDLAIIQTVDFFTPIVDDPYVFGAIAAANSLSDVYAMGGRPALALNIVAFPRNSDATPMSVLKEILRGGAEKAKEAGIDIVGGHSIDDNEPKYGLCVTGLVHPDRFWTNVGARPGDKLVLTKPLGTGIITTALRAGKAGEDLVARSTCMLARTSRASDSSVICARCLPRAVSALA